MASYAIGVMPKEIAEWTRDVETQLGVIFDGNQQEQVMGEQQFTYKLSFKHGDPRCWLIRLFRGTSGQTDGPGLRQRWGLNGCHLLKSAQNDPLKLQLVVI